MVKIEIVCDRCGKVIDELKGNNLDKILDLEDYFGSVRFKPQFSYGSIEYHLCKICNMEMSVLIDSQVDNRS